MEIETFLKKMREQGTGDFDLSFACVHSRAFQYGLAARPSERGLLALSRAVLAGTKRVALDGDNRACSLTFSDKRFHYGQGVFSTVLQRGVFAPLNLTVNGKRLLPVYRSPLSSFELEPGHGIVSGVVHRLSPRTRGQVVLVDRGVSFPLGPLFGSIRAIVHTSPLKGAPWPTRLVLNSELGALLYQVWCLLD